MLLAATKATFKSEFGQSFIRSEYHVSNRNVSTSHYNVFLIYIFISKDLALESFEKRYLNERNIAANDAADDSSPLSFVERELALVAKDRASGISFAIHPSQSLRGVQFPIDQNAIQKIKEFSLGSIDFVQLSIGIFS
jgi:hypothetical protein